MKKQKIIALALAVLLVLITVFVCGFWFANKNTTVKTMDAQDYRRVFTLDGTLGHNSENFTEGLFVYRGDLFESTGIAGSSEIIKYNGISAGIKTGTKLPDGVFGEGSAVFDGTLYALTWKDKKAFLIDPETLRIKKTVDYDREGWGLTTDGKFLIASDGTDTLYYMDADLHPVKSIRVTYRGQSVTDINELEYDGRYIWANIWRQNVCIAIDPESGNVHAAVDFSDICPERTSEDDVQNGIAYDGTYYYFTGKNWSVIYKMKLSDDPIS